MGKKVRPCLLADWLQHGAQLSHVEAQLLLQALHALHILQCELAVRVLVPPYLQAGQ